MKTKSNAIFTIGHSVRESAEFIELLKLHCIEAVADVRSTPYSRWQPHFNETYLKETLKMQGIKYVFLGKELGARSDDLACYEDYVIKGGRRVSFETLKRAELFRSGIQRVIDGSERMNIALMCAEKDPIKCHRNLLVANELYKKGKHIIHILDIGKTETQEEIEKRMHVMNGRDESQVYMLKEYLDEMSRRKQERRIAYVRKDGNAQHKMQ